MDLFQNGAKSSLYPPDVEMCLPAILDLLGDPALWEGSEFHAEALIARQHLSESMVSATEQAYRELLEKKRS
ncbi:MAG: hypothetical protein P8X64_13425 [Anaerolineales bacterium]